MLSGSRPVLWSGSTARAVLLLTRAVLLGAEKLQNNTVRKLQELCIRAPLMMILGPLESQQRALQLYAEKHHSPNTEGKTKR
jgi:hypothetical protein